MGDRGSDRLNGGYHTFTGVKGEQVGRWFDRDDFINRFSLRSQDPVVVWESATECQFFAGRSENGQNPESLSSDRVNSVLGH